MRLAVVGHVEWVELLRVERVPEPGSIVHVQGSFEQAAGGGAVAAVQLAKLAGACDSFTALGDDGHGRQAREQLEGDGVRVHAETVPEPQRRAVTFVDAEGERTITVIGDRLVPLRSQALPWHVLAEADGVYFTGGDVGALQAARAARVLTATPRTLATLREAAVELDALVGSASDPGEAYSPGDLEPAPRLRVATMAERGGVAEPGGPFRAAPLPGPVVDTYGAGDSFAAGLTYGLAAGWSRTAAIELAARCGAAVLTGRGAYEGQLRLS
jgi:ribokinase